MRWKKDGRRTCLFLKVRHKLQTIGSEESEARALHSTLGSSQIVIAVVVVVVVPVRVRPAIPVSVMSVMSVMTVVVHPHSLKKKLKHFPVAGSFLGY